MKKEDLYDAIGEMDEDILARSEAHRPRRWTWQKVLGLAASLMLVVSVGISGFLFAQNRAGAAGSAPVRSEEPQRWGTAADSYQEATEPPRNETSDADIIGAGCSENYQIGYEMLLVEDTLYYSTYSMNPEYTGEIDIGVWRYDPQVGENVRLGDFSATFVRAQSGNYCLSQTTNEVYQIGDGGLEKRGTIPSGAEMENTVLIGVVEDQVYFAKITHGDYSPVFYEMNLQDGTVREIYRDENGLMLEDCYLRDGIIYYRTTYQTADPQFYALDINSGVSEVIKFDFEKGNPYIILQCEYYDDCIVISDYWSGDKVESLHRLDYDTKEVTLVTQQEHAIMKINRQGNQLFYESSYFYLYTYGEVPTPYGKLTVCELWDNTLTELDEEIYTDDLHAFSGGYYYNDIRESVPGLYFYNNSTGETIRIDTAES